MASSDPAEQSLPGSQRQLKTFVEHAPMSVAMFDRNMNYLATSVRWLENYSRGYADLVGRNHYDVHPDLPEGWRDVHRRALAGSTLKNDEEFWVLTDGTRHWLRWAVMPWLDDHGTIGGVIIFADEITDRKLAEERLRESEQRYSAIFAASPFAAALSQMPESVITDVNEAFLTLFEYERDEVIGRVVADLRITDHESQARLRNELRSAGTVRDFECVGNTRSGRRPILLLNLDWVDVGGAKHLLTTARDITERKHAEETVRLYEQTRELDQLKSRFFANISHELRTPLSLIIGPVERILGYGSLERNVRTDLQVVERNARTLQGHVNDLLDVARLDAGHVRPHYVDMDVATIVRFISDHFSALAAEQSIEFIVDLPAALKAQIDPEKLRRIVFNLLSNAFKFTPRGGRVCVSAHETRGRFTVEVADSGPGIPEASRADVFERFHRLEGEGAPLGTGLGLAIVKEFTSLLGGDVSIEDSADGGALFIVDLPAVAPPGTALRAIDSSTPSAPRPEATKRDDDRPPPAAGRARRNGSGNVLVVEDNRDMNTFIADSLSDAGFSVQVAFDGLQGYQMATEHPPDIVLTDIMLPAMSGDELLRALRQNVSLDSTPVVVLTAKADEQLRIRLLRAGAQDYLTKPFSFEELRTRVRNLVARKRAEEETNRLHAQMAAAAVETERLYARERTERAWLQAVVDQMPDGVVLMDEEGRVSVENRSAMALAGPRPRNVDRFGNVQNLDLRRPSGEQIASDELPIVRALVRGETTVGSELIALRADGELVPVLIGAAPICTSDGMLVGATMVIQDITTLKELERLREEWASIVAHDLQQPINSIVLRADLLLRGGITDQQRKDLYQIRSSAQRLSRMARDLTDASQLESRRLSLTLRRLDIGELILEIVEHHPDVAARTRVRIPPDRRLFVQGDAGRLEQVIANLLSNALKHGAPDTEIRLELEDFDDHVEISVTNQGQGVSNEDVQSLFERYTRARRASASGTKGLGLGLYIARGLVEAHGGHIWAESAPGRITKFAFSLPLDGPPLPAMRLQP